MADTSREKKLSDALAKHLDTIELNSHWVVFSLSDKGTAIQQRMYDLCMGFLSNWAWRYQKNEIQPNQILYPICKASHTMLEALTNEIECEGAEPGRHAEISA